MSQSSTLLPCLHHVYVRLCTQIVIQVGDEVDGVAMVRCAADVRSADHTGKEGDVLYKEILCPLKYLQEV